VSLCVFFRAPSHKKFEFRKIEQGETQEEALKRELLEELDI
jgi:hypothetical protein